MFKYLKRLLGKINTGFLVKSYIISAVILAVLYTASKGTIPFIFYVNAIIFPLAHLVINDLMVVLRGNTIRLINPIISIFVTIMKYIFLFGFAFLIAPIGLIYLMIGASKEKK